MQDIGARFYTYTTTIGYVLEAAAKRKIRGRRARSAQSDRRLRDRGSDARRAERRFIALSSPMPVRHGMTLGELAQLFNDERKIGADLTVVACEGWRRDEWFDETGLPWVNPSPNMRSLTAGDALSGHRRSSTRTSRSAAAPIAPFEQIGAPWIDGRRLAEALNARGLPGIRFYPVAFTPASSVYAKEACQGVYMIVTDRAALLPVRVGLEIAAALWRLHGDAFDQKTSEPAVRLTVRFRPGPRRRGSGGDRRRLGRGRGGLATPACEDGDSP